jgi:hypothetical protein
MSLNSHSPSPFATTLNKTTGSKYSCSRKRWDGFSAWQEHVRKLAGSVGSAPFPSRDRDLRRPIVPG